MYKPGWISWMILAIAGVVLPAVAFILIPA